MCEIARSKFVLLGQAVSFEQTEIFSNGKRKYNSSSCISLPSASSTRFCSLQLWLASRALYFILLYTLQELLHLKLHVLESCCLTQRLTLG